MTAATLGAFPAAIVWPLLGAILLMLLPSRTTARTVARVAMIASLLTLALALAEAIRPAPGASGPGGSFWLRDRLALSLPVLLAVPGMLSSAWLLGRMTLLQGVTGRAWRHPLVASQLLTAGALDAVRADPLFLMLAGFALVSAALAMLAPARLMATRVAILGALLLVAWFGIAMLSAGLGVPASWSALVAAAAMHPALRLFGRLLLMLPMLLLAWLGAGFSLAPPPAAPEADRSPVATAAHALLPLLPGVPALVVALRLCALPEPDPSLVRIDMLALTGAGLLIVLLGLALLPGRRTLADRIVTVGIMQLGAAAIGFGAGGTLGVAAGLLMLSFLCLGLPLAWLPAAAGAAGWIRRVSILSFAGLPPFGPFAAVFMLLLRLFADLPVLAVLVLAAFWAAAVALLSASWPAHDVERPALAAHLLPASLVLLLLATCGVAMPGPASDWLLGIGESLAGSTWTARTIAHPGTTP